MRKWIASLLIFIMLSGSVCYADDTTAAGLEVIFEDTCNITEDGFEIETDESEIPEEQEEFLLGDTVMEDAELTEIGLNSEWVDSDLEDVLPEYMEIKNNSSSSICGVWVGTYIGTHHGNNVDRTIRLDIDNRVDNRIEGIATIDGGDNGSYFFDGTLNEDNGNIVFRGTDWIENPNNFTFFTFSGILKDNNNTIEGHEEGNESKTFSLHKESDSYITKRINIQSIPKDWKGEYDGNKGNTVVRRNYEIHIQEIDSDGKISGTAIFTPSEKSDPVLGANGSYYFTGKIDERRGKIKIQGNEWIEYPNNDKNWEFIVLEGFIDQSLTSISGKSEKGIWAMIAYHSELDNYYTKQPEYPIIIENNHGTKGIFYESLERYITNMDSDKYYPDLAYMLVALAGAAYNNRGAQSGLLSQKNAGYQSDSKELYHITKAYEDLGFADYQLFNYYNNPDESAYGEDNVAFTIGRKQLSDDEALVLIVVRGSYGGISNFTSDWQSNTKIKTNSKGRHQGFARAADKVYSALTSFLKNRQYSNAAIKSNIRYVITGHSRGGAVANLLAVKLHDVGVPNSKVYDYNFACPDTVKGLKFSNLKKNHENIFNICNSADAISVIPGVVGDAVSGVGYAEPIEAIKEKYKSLFLSWGKYGTTRFYCKNWNSKEEFDLLRTFDVSNSPHDYKYYVTDIGKNTYNFYTWSEIVARRIELNVTDGINTIINMFYPGYALIPGDITKAKVEVDDQVYTGKALKPAVKVVLNKTELKKDTDYTVSYKKNKSIGTASIIVKGKGSYQGTTKVTFKINPRPVTGLNLASVKKALTVNWDRASGIDGYQLQYSTKDSFSSAEKIKITKAATTKKTIKNLKKRKTYYVRIRSFKKVNGKTYYSAWSATEKIKM